MGELGRAGLQTRGGEYELRGAVDLERGESPGVSGTCTLGLDNWEALDLGAES